jgi:hypothetical protein
LPQVRDLIPDVQRCGDVWVIKRNIVGQSAVVALTFSTVPVGQDLRRVRTWEPQLMAIEIRFIPSNSYPDLNLLCEAEILDAGDDLVVFDRVTHSALVGGVQLEKTDTRRVWLRGTTWIELKTNKSVGVVLTFVDSTWRPEFDTVESRP